MQKVADIYEAYDLEKQKRLFLDFDDLLLETYHLLNENESVREKYRGTFHHLSGRRVPGYQPYSNGDS